MATPIRQAPTGIVRVDYKNYHRYKIDGRWAIGVTTALKGVPKDDVLKRWASKLVATYAVEHNHEVQQMIQNGGPGPAISFLKELPDQRRNDAAVRGTDVHSLAEQYIRGEEIQVSEHLEPYVQGYANYIRDYNPTTVHEELIVASRTHGYAGKLDSIQDIPRIGRALVDYKTSNGIYGVYALQCAAYRYAEVLVDENGHEHPMIPVDQVLILHIKPWDYALVPVRADENVLRMYLAAQANYLLNVQSNKLEKLLGEPLELSMGRDAA